MAEFFYKRMDRELISQKESKKEKRKNRKRQCRTDQKSFLEAISDRLVKMEEE
jgi:hypothetical protein